MGLMAVGTLVTAGGQLYSGYAGKTQAESSANMEKYNAQVALRQKHMIEQRGKRASILQAEAGSRKLSSVIAAGGGSGAVGQTGVILDVLGTQAVENEKENLMIGYDTQVAASQAQSQADLHKMQASIFKTRGKNIMTSAFIGAGTTLLKGFGSGSGGGGGGKVGGKPRGKDLWGHRSSSFAWAGAGGGMTRSGGVGSGTSSAKGSSVM